MRKRKLLKTAENLRSGDIKSFVVGNPKIAFKSSKPIKQSKSENQPQNVEKPNTDGIASVTIEHTRKLLPTYNRLQNNQKILLKNQNTK